MVSFLTSPAAAALGVDHTRVFVSGDSAGGNLSITTLLHLQQAQAAAVGHGDEDGAQAGVEGLAGDWRHVRGMALIYPATVYAAGDFPSRTLFGKDYPPLFDSMMQVGVWC